MKKTTAQVRSLHTTPVAKKLFGVSADQLKTVTGGGGVIIHQDDNVLPKP